MNQIELTANETPQFDIESTIFLGISAFPGVGMQTLRRLGGRYGINAILREPDLQRTPLAGVSRDWDHFRAVVSERGNELASRLTRQGVRLVFHGDKGYPERLSALPVEQRPQWLFLRGDARLLESPTLGVVGTRSPSPVGEFLTQYCVSVARSRRLTVVSGLAKGVDGIAHEWALKLGAPTISVLGTGILRSYPANHAELGDDIVSQGGLLVSEYPPLDEPRKERFIERNRIQAAISDVLIPTEWKAKSGTAHTVRFAQLLGRPVLNVEMVGVQRSSAAGRADCSFDIPDEHDELVAAIMRAPDSEVVRGPVMRIPQPTLFDGLT